MPRLNDCALEPVLGAIFLMAICVVSGLSQTRLFPIGKPAVADVSHVDADTTRIIDMDRRDRLPVATVEPDSGLTARRTDLHAAVGAPPVDTGRPAKDENDDR